MSVLWALSVLIVFASLWAAGVLPKPVDPKYGVAVLGFLGVLLNTAAGDIRAARLCKFNLAPSASLHAYTA